MQHYVKKKEQLYNKENEDILHVYKYRDTLLLSKLKQQTLHHHITVHSKYMVLNSS